MISESEIAVQDDRMGSQAPEKETPTPAQHVASCIRKQGGVGGVQE